MAFRITYEIDSEASELIDAIRVEQTIEFPFRLAPSWIQDQIVGEVLSIEEIGNGRSRVKISYDDGVVNNELPQFLNLLWGNVSLFRGVLIVDIEFPDSFLQSFAGPRFGDAGIRNLLSIGDRPILMTALKPMGTSSVDLASMATALVEGGIDVIKDDHNLANQPWAQWRERVNAIAAAVQSANERFGRQAIYAPSLNRPTEQLFDSARYAREIGCGALLVLPGICGFDAMRAIADDDSIAIPIISHPALIGSFVMNQVHGLTHDLAHATLVRLSGGDFTIFPNHGGRFSYSIETCREIVFASHSSLGELRSTSPTLAGGMTVERVPEMIREFGREITILIGGALHDGDLLENTRRLREAVEKS